MKKKIGRPKSETFLFLFFAPNLKFPHSCTFLIDFHLLLRLENVHSEVSFPFLSNTNTSRIQMKIKIAISVLSQDSWPSTGVFENVSNFREKIMMTKSAKFWRLSNLICTSEGEVCESLENAKRSPLGKSPSGEEKTRISRFHSAPTLAKSFESSQTKGFDFSHSTNNWLSSHQNMSAMSLCIVFSISTRCRPDEIFYTGVGSISGVDSQTNNSFCWIWTLTLTEICVWLISGVGRSNYQPKLIGGCHNSNLFHPHFPCMYIESMLLTNRSTNQPSWFSGWYHGGE